MLTPAEFDRVIDQRARALKAKVPTPAHSEAVAANEYAAGQEEISEAERRRRRVQHEVDPCPGETAEVVAADLDKVYRQAYDTPSGYPAMGSVSPEGFRRGPIMAGEAAYGVGYDPSGPPVPIPSLPPGAGLFSRPLITDGQSRACATEGSGC